MSASRTTRALGALLAASVLASCGDAPAPGASDRDGRRGNAQVRDEGREKPSERGQVETRADRSEPDGDQRRRAEPASTTPNQTDGGNDASSTGTWDGAGSQPQGVGSAASSCLADRSGDLDSSGSAPAYVDLTRGCVREQGDVVTVEATTAGDLPGRTEDDHTHASIAFELTPPSGSSIFVHADAAASGWTAHLSRGNQQRELDGALTISGDRLRIEFPSSELGSVRQLQWALTSSWLESTLLSTSYAFDTAPEAGSARFDR